MATIEDVKSQRMAYSSLRCLFRMNSKVATKKMMPIMPMKRRICSICTQSP
ncbi:MAG: hypothetical protein ABSB94_02625 [Syntrophorhabdales bacterium]